MVHTLYLITVIIIFFNLHSVNLVGTYLITEQDARLLPRWSIGYISFLLRGSKSDWCWGAYRHL